MSINFGRNKMTHQEILNKTKAEIDSLCAQAKEKLEAMAPKALEIGKWYRHKDYPRFLSIHLNDDRYGFDISGDWFDNVRNKLSYHEDYYEATPQEVEKALIEEAKRRGFVIGCCHYITNGEKVIKKALSERFLFEPYSNKLLFNNWSIFECGKWANIIEQDKFAELKEAHRNGAVIQANDGQGWYDTDYPNWLSKEYRIKPEEKPKVGDVCKFWSDDEPGFIVSHYLRGDNGLHTFDGSIYFDHARVITPQQVQELLFNNK